jgi:hypothetical protein
MIPDLSPPKNLEILPRLAFFAMGAAIILVEINFGQLEIAGGWEAPGIPLGVIRWAIDLIGLLLVFFGIFYPFCLQFLQKVKSYSSPVELLAVSDDSEMVQQIWSVWLILLFVVIFYADKIVLGVDAPIRIHDTFDNDFPRMLNEGNLLLKYGFFGWYPHIGGGVPAFGVHYTPYHPLVLLATIVPLWLVYSVNVLIFMALAGIGMYLFLLRLMSLPNWVSLLGGILFCLNSQIQANALVFNVFPFLFPLFLVTTSGRLFAKTSPFRVAVSILVGFSILTFSFVTITLVFYAFAHLAVTLLLTGKSWRYRLWAGLGVCIIWGGYAILNLPVLYTLLYFSQHYSRDYQLALDYWPPGPFWKIFINDSLWVVSKVGGIPLMFLAILLMKHSLEIRKFMGVAILLLAMAAVFTSNFQLSFEVLARMDLGHFSFPAPFFLTVALSLVVVECQSKKISVLQLASMITMSAGVFALCFYLGVFKFSNNETFLVNIFVTATLIGIVIIRKYLGGSHIRQAGNWKARRIVLSLIVVAPILFAVGSFRLERQLHESKDYLPLYGDTGLEDYIRPEDQVYRLGTLGEVPPSFLYMNEGEGVDGRAIAFFQNYKDVFELIIEDGFEGDEDERKYFKAYFYNLYLGTKVSTLNTTLLRLLNLKYIITQARFPTTGDWQLVEEIELGKPLDRSDNSETKLYMYELLNSFERGFLVPNAKQLKSDDAVLDALANETVEGLRSHVYMMGEEACNYEAYVDSYPDLLEAFSNRKDGYSKKLYGKTHYSTWGSKEGRNCIGSSLSEGSNRKEGNLSLMSRGSVGHIDIKEYLPDKIVFKVENNHPTFVVISNNYHPKWRAKLDGEEVTLHRANHAFQAVYLQNVGEHELVLEFLDPILWWTHIGLLVGLILFSVGVVVETRLFDAVRSTSKIS